MYKNHFCLVWKSNASCFNTAVEKLKNVDNIASDKHVKSFFLNLNINLKKFNLN